jgi:hypothetical protein
MMAEMVKHVVEYVTSFESDDSYVAFSGQLIWNFVVAGLLKYICAVTQRLQKETFGNRYFLCGRSVDIKVR